MTSHTPSDHFAGKSVAEHLKAARTKGSIAAAEIHGIETPGHYNAGLDAAKETALALSILWVANHFLGKSMSVLILFSCGFLIWKVCRSALLGWMRMERLHRLIEEERWEIEHHREQEREELTEMYRAKGFSGKLLQEVIDVLMADDNRLLRVMLEEELGLTLEAYEHPLRQAVGAGLGVLCSSVLLVMGEWLFPRSGLLVAAGIVLLCSAILSAKLEKNRLLSQTIWTLAVAGLAIGVVYFIAKYFTAL